MNTLTGKSAGIALLLAAALIAALVAVGVFSASGAGAQSTGPTATAALVDMNDDATESKADDTLVITFSGLTKQAGPNTITLTMEAALGDTTATGFALSWKGGNQAADVPTIAAHSGGADGNYTISLGTATVIESGSATLEITTLANTIDSNTMITALTLGREGLLQTVSNTPIGITGAPAGPTITLDPMVYSAGPANADGSTAYTVPVTVNGANFGASTSTDNVAITVGTGGTLTGVTLVAAVDINNNADATPGADDEITAGSFEEDIELSVPNNASSGTVELIATQAGDTVSVTLYFMVEDAEKVTGTISSNVAGATDVEMTLSFTAIQAVDDDDSKIKVTLNNVSGLMQDNIMVQKTGDEVGMVMEPSGNMFYIAEAATGGTNIGTGDEVKVTITGLTNGSNVPSATVKQGMFGAGMVSGISEDGTDDTRFALVDPTAGGFVPGPTVAPTPTTPATPTPQLTISPDVDAEMVFAPFNHAPGAVQPTMSRTVTGMIGSEAALNLSFDATSSDEDVATVTISTRGMTNADGDVTGASAIVTPAGPGTATVTVTATTSGGLTDMTSWEVTVPGVVSSTNKADADVVLEIFARAGAEIRGGRDIVVGLPGYSIPEGGIDESDVLVDGHAAGSYYGNPADVTVSGPNVAITIPTKVVGAGGQSIDTQINPGNYTIRFKDGAGLRNPNSAGNKIITVGDSDATAQKMPVTIISHISVPPASTWVERGDTVEVTAKGINADGDATVHLHGAHTAREIANLEAALTAGRLDGEDLAALPALDRSPRDGGTAVLSFDTSSSIFNAQAVDAVPDNPRTPADEAKNAAGTNVLIVVDAAGIITGWTRLGLQPTVDLDVTEVRRTGRMKVTVDDWYYGNIDDLFVNGIQVRLPDPNDPDASIVWSRQSPPTTQPLTVVVPRRARLGTMEVRVDGTTMVKQGTAISRDKHVQTVHVGVFDLDITPKVDGQPTAVTDQVIRMEGDGFGASECIVEITVGDEHIREATTGDEVGNRDNCVKTDTDGSLSNSFKVPHNLKPGDYTVVARDALNRVGEGELTVPEPKITVTPSASQRGSTVTVVGENFPAEDIIGVNYDNDPVTVATTDTVGKFRATFKVPVDATIGKEFEVEALSEKKGTGQPVPGSRQLTVKLSDTETHTVPAETLKVWPAGQAEPPDGTTEVSTISSGGRLQVEATNLPPHTKVSLGIGGIAVAGRVLGEDAAADSAGRYTDSVLVPQLTPGTHTVQLDVHTIGTDVVVVTFVDISEIITRPTGDVFADLIDAGQLLVVWHYDNATGMWSLYDPMAVAESDLTLVSTGDIVWVEVTEAVRFQGQSLFEGWNLISLE